MDNQNPQLDSREGQGKKFYLGPRTNGRRSYDQIPWWAKVISTSGVAGLIAIMLIINQQKTQEAERRQQSIEASELRRVISGLHEALDKQSDALLELKGEVKLLRHALSDSARRGRPPKLIESDSHGG